MVYTINACLLLVTLVTSLSIRDSIVFISEGTPNTLLGYFSNAVSILNLSLSPGHAIEAILTSLNFLFFIDITLSKSYFPLLNSFSARFEISYISISKSSSLSESRISAHYSFHDEAKALSTLLNYTSVSKFVFLGPASAENIEFSNQIKTLPNFDKFISYSNDISITTAKSIAIKMIKVNGITAILLSDSSSSISVIEKGLIDTRFNKIGAILIYTSFSFPATLIEGGLLISEYSETVAVDLAQYHYFGILRVLDCFNNKVSNKDLGIFDKQMINQVLRECNLQSANFTIFNVQGNTTKRIGSIITAMNYSQSSTTIITGTLVYPGNITSRVQNAQATITLSIANGTNDPYNTYHFEMLANFFQGSLYAVKQINKNNEIPYFTIKLTPTDCGMFWYEKSWYLSCHSKLLNDIGVAYITSFFGQAIKGNIYTLRALNHIIPQVSPLGIDSSLDNKKEYPELVKLESSFDVYNGVKISVLKALGYQSVIIIGSNETESQLKEYTDFCNLMVNNGMNVIDFTPQFGFIPKNYTRDEYEQYKPFFQWIRNTGCSVFFIDVQRASMLLEGLYDVGYRKGEIVIFADLGALTSLDDTKEPYLSKRKELVEGTIVYSYREWVGDIGMKAYEELSAMYPEVTYMCMTYDAVLVIKEAINNLLAVGGDYEDYSSLMSSIRNNKFSGCLGNVFFDRDGNTRASGEYLFQQIYFNETSSKLKTRDLLYFNRFSSQTMTQINPIVWPTGVPIPNFRPYNRCPFDDYQITTSEKGKNVLYGVSAAVLILCVIVGFIAVCSFPSSADQLIENKIISFDDFIFFGYFFLQFFQYLALGPDQNSYKYFLNNFQVLLSLNFDLFFKLTFSKFWALYNAVCGITIYCVVMFPIYLGFLEARFGDSLIYKKLSELARLTVPYLCHLGYMPILSMLLNIFNCIEGVGSNYSDSYLAQDCTIFCYTGLHKQYVILVSIFMALFLILTVYHRPYFEQNNDMLHVKTKTSYLTLLSVVQTSIAVLNKTLKIYSQVIHGIAVASILMAFLVFTLFTHPFNYGRAKVSQCISLICSIWAITVSTIFIELSLIEVWTIVEFFGLAFIVFFGMIFLKKSEELLYSERGISISALFIFQFCRDYSKYKSNVQSIEDLPIIRNNKRIDLTSKNSL